MPQKILISAKLLSPWWYHTHRTGSVVYDIITDTTEDSTSGCAQSTRSSHNEVNLFI